MTTHVVVPLDDETVEQLRSYGVPLEDVIGRVVTVMAERVDPEILASLLLKAERRPEGVAMLSSRGVEELLGAVKENNRIVKKLESDVKRVEKMLAGAQGLREVRHG